MSRLALEYAKPAATPTPGWTKQRWTAWLVLFVALGIWAGLIISA